MQPAAAAPTQAGATIPRNRPALYRPPRLPCYVACWADRCWGCPNYVELPHSNVQSTSSKPT
eukprot:351515-Chlamydomonas_euryale.AAC.4